MKQNSINQCNELLLDISIILPAYNEEENIEEVVEKTACFLMRQKGIYEIIVVNDGSTDGTSKILAKLKERYVFINVINLENNQGYGNALKLGFYNAKNNYVFFMDSDNQFNIKQLIEFWLHINKFDVIVGYRYQRYDTFLRQILSWGFNKLCFFWFGLRLHDIDCAFKLFKKECIKNIEITSKDFFINAEIMIRLKANKVSILELPVTHYPRLKGVTTVKSGHIPKTLKTMYFFWCSIKKNTVEKSKKKYLREKI